MGTMGLEPTTRLQVRPNRTVADDGERLCLIRLGFADGGVRQRMFDRCSIASLGTIPLRSSTRWVCPQEGRTVGRKRHRSFRNWVWRFLRVERSFLAKSDVISPGIDNVEGALPPWPHKNIGSGLAVNLIWRQHSKLSSAFVDDIDIVDRKIDRLGPSSRRHSSLGDVNDAEDDPSTVEIVASSSMALAFDTKKPSIEICGAL